MTAALAVAVVACALYAALCHFDRTRAKAAREARLQSIGR